MLDELELGGYEEDDFAGRHRRRPPSRRSRSAMAALLVFGLLAALGAVVFWSVGELGSIFSAPDYTGAGTGSVSVQIQPGQGAGEIGNTLYSKGVVKSARAFVNAADDNSQSRNLQPGYYQLRKQMKASAALALLLDPKSKLISKVTIPEGKTAAETFDILSEKLNIPVDQFQQAAKDPEALGVPASWFTRTDGKQVQKSIEGFLYPSTYDFDPSTTAQSALREMVQRFLQTAASAGLDKPQGISPYEALIVASLTQAEAGVAEDLPKIARVVYNRLKSPDAWMNKLQFDSTTNYWLKLNGKSSKNSYDLTDAELNDPNNPYSTHAHAGLPPGPINSPGEAAMKGAVNPTPGNWLYFVKISQDGHSAFEDTNAQHEADVQRAKQNGVK